jgi:predicted phage terminase large subunit-like protein
MLPTADALAVEWARRSLARFVPYMDDALVPAHHHRLLIEQLHRVERGEINRLMVFWPPGHAKSKYSSEYGPAWLMGRNKRKTIIHATYGTDFAERFGRKIRNIMRSQEYERVFGATLSADSRAAGEWETIQGGEYKAAGVGAGITGRRADIGLIDDPVKSRKEADSPTYRQNTWDWYLADFRTRLKPGGSIIIIQTRWHEDDLSGRILPKGYDSRSGWVTARDGEPWYVLNFPAICESESDGTGRSIGEALWPGYITMPMLEQLKRTQGTRNWDSLYQQRPRPSDGGIFKEAWTRNRYGVIPQAASVCVHSWDTAQKPDQLNDPSVMTAWRMGRGVPGYYLGDVYRDRVDYPTLKRKVVAYAERDRPAAILIEDKSSGQSLIQDLRSTTTLPIIAIEPVGDKTFRANEVSAMVEAGLVFLPEPGIMAPDGGSARYPWLIDFEGELFGFPLVTHDDQVDSMTQFLKWVRNWSGRIESHGAGLIRSSADATTQDDGIGFGSASRGGDLSGFL